MSGWLGGGSSGSSITKETSLQISTSTYGKCFALVYGRARIPCNVLDYDDFKAKKQKSGGKGGGGQTTGYKYYASVLLGLCEGPIRGIGTIWKDKKTTGLSAEGMTLRYGIRPQTPWSTWTSKHSAKALGYSGLAHVCKASMRLSSSAGLPNLNFEIDGIDPGVVISVPGSARPWNSPSNTTGCTANALYDFPGTSSVAPVVALTDLTVGESLTVTVSGAVANGSTPNTWQPVTQYTDQMTGTNPGQFLGINDIWSLTLIAAFTDDDGQVISATWIHTTSSTLTVPSGATRLQFGINDDIYGNLGAYTVHVQPTVSTTKIDGIYPDAFPPDVWVDFLTNPYRGVGVESARLGDLTTGSSSWGAYCQASGFVISPAWTEQQAASACCQEMLDATNSEARLHATSSGMVLEVLPLGDSEVVGTYATYEPDNAIRYDLKDEDFLGVLDASGNPTGDPAIKVTITSPADCYNSVPVEYHRRSDDYNVATEEEPNAADVGLNGLKKASTLSLHLIKLQAHAQAISRLKAARNIYIRRTYEFKLGWKYMRLEPLDLVTLTYARLGLSAVPVRIITIDSPSDTDEESGFTVKAEEWPFGVASHSTTSITAVASSGSTTTSSTSSTTSTTAAGADPGSVNTPIIFEPPALLVGSSDPEIWIGASGASENWGGCYVHVSTDGGSSYSQVGTIGSGTVQGVLSAILATSSTSSDTTNTLSVDVSESLGELDSTDANGLAAHTMLALVGSELIAYETATLSDDYAYALTTMLRGLYGTTIAAHSSGASFLLVDESLLKISYSASLQGTVLYIKLQSFNALGECTQDLSDCTAYSFTPRGRQLLDPDERDRGRHKRKAEHHHRRHQRDVPPRHLRGRHRLRRRRSKSRPEALAGHRLDLGRQRPDRVRGGLRDGLQRERPVHVAVRAGQG